MVVPHFFVQQRITVMVNRYEIRAANPDGTEGALMAFAEQKRMKLKEEVDLLRRRVEDPPRSSPSRPASGSTSTPSTTSTTRAARPLGYFSKQFGASLLRSTWNLSAPGHRRPSASERRPVIAILRRVWDFIPYIGDVWVPVRLPLRLRRQRDRAGRCWSASGRRRSATATTVTVPDPRLDFRVAAAHGRRPGRAAEPLTRSRGKRCTRRSWLPTSRQRGWLRQTHRAGPNSAGRRTHADGRSGRTPPDGSRRRRRDPARRVHVLAA